MRWFWLFILALCALTGGLYAQRTSAQQAEQQRLQEQIEAQQAQSAPTRRPRRERSDPTPAEAIPEPVPEVPARATAEQASEPIDTPAAQEYEAQRGSEQSQDATPEPEPEAMDGDGDGDDPADLAQGTPGLGPEQAIEPDTPAEQATIDATPEPTGEIVIDLPAREPSPEPEPEQVQPAAPSYELGEDGSFKVLDANLWVQGSGTEGDPFVLSWEVLQSIQKRYDPKAGSDTLPDWLGLMEGKFVTIEGNTLVPVVASSTRELLVMKNPWDGCCIGVPPTPYDAVEVSLSHDVDFGNSAVGYGSVVGVFYADPYVVDGWVLGVYIIEDAEYRSGEGVVFPEF